jgi:hypothetical protein
MITSLSPSLSVLSSYKDYPGFTDNVNGPSGIIAWAARGYIHCIFGDSSKRANLTPVDYCINALIATAWDIHETYVHFLTHRALIIMFRIAVIRSD